VKPEALVALVAFALGACGAEDWSFEEDAGDAAARADSPDGGCTSDSDCKLLHCDATSGQCVACVTDSQCTQIGLPFCYPKLERCVQCSVDADCGGAGQACQPTTHQCVTSCTSDGMCPNESLCGPAHFCVECVTDLDCFDGRGGLQPQEECDTMIGECAECTSDAQCPPSSVCDRTTDRCVGCLTNSDCPRDAACNPDVHMCVGLTDASAFEAEDGR
jgi:hypothetical protein